MTRGNKKKSGPGPYEILSKNDTTEFVLQIGEPLLQGHIIHQKWDDQRNPLLVDYPWIISAEPTDLRRADAWQNIYEGFEPLDECGDGRNVRKDAESTSVEDLVSQAAQRAEIHAREQPSREPQ